MSKSRATKKVQICDEPITPVKTMTLICGTVEAYILAYHYDIENNSYETRYSQAGETQYRSHNQTTVTGTKQRFSMDPQLREMLCQIQHHIVSTLNDAIDEEIAPNMDVIAELASTSILETIMEYDVVNLPQFEAANAVKSKAGSTIVQSFKVHAYTTHKTIINACAAYFDNAIKQWSKYFAILTANKLSVIRLEQLYMAMMYDNVPITHYEELMLESTTICAARRTVKAKKGDKPATAADTNIIAVANDDTGYAEDAEDNGEDDQ